MSDPTQDPKILNAQRILGYQFNNLIELRRALAGDRSLALFGDKLIGQVLVREGIRRQATPSRMSQILQARASNPYLIQQGFSTGFAECIYPNRAQGDQIFPGPVADAVEAVIATAFFDSSVDMQVVEGVMRAFNICWP